jgi:hypothetical protein
MGQLCPATLVFVIIYQPRVSGNDASGVIREHSYRMGVYHPMPAELCESNTNDIQFVFIVNSTISSPENCSILTFSASKAARTLEVFFELRLTDDRGKHCDMKHVKRYSKMNAR